MSLKLRPTISGDLPFVVRIEAGAARSGVVSSQSREEHENYLKNEDIRHLIIENEGAPVGYAILAGLKNRHENLELKRIVVAETGKGYGRRALRLIKKTAFEELNAHRLWLDVADFNERAQALYESEDFKTEGVWRECLKRDAGRGSLVFMSILRSEYLSS